MLEALEARLVGELKRHHASQPLSEGMPREEARGRTSRRAAPAVFELVVDRLTRAGRIVARDRLALSEHQVSLSDEEASARLAIERVYREAKLTPPEIGAAASAAGVETALAGRVATLLVRSRTLVKLDVLLYHQASLDELEDRDSSVEGAGCEREARRRIVQGALRRQQEVCDSVAGVPGPGAGDPAGRGVAGRTVKV